MIATSGGAAGVGIDDLTDPGSDMRGPLGLLSGVRAFARFARRCDDAELVSTITATAGPAVLIVGKQIEPARQQRAVRVAIWSRPERRAVVLPQSQLRHLGRISQMGQLACVTFHRVREPLRRTVECCGFRRHAEAMACIVVEMCQEQCRISE